jgi:hypothetical protein
VDQFRVRARVPLRRDEAAQASGLDSTFAGEGPLEWVQSERQHYCQRVGSVQGSTFTVLALKLNWTPDPGSDPNRPSSGVARSRP